jgi:LuxR family transcriptional regulator, maltose regulon positive regulatory protein
LTASISLVCGQLFSSLFFFDFHRTNLRIPPDLSPVSIRLALLFLLLTRGALGREILEGLQREIESMHNHYFALRVATHLSVVRLSANQVTEALSGFRSVLNVSAPAGIYQTILDEGPRVGDLLTAFQENAERRGNSGKLMPYVATLIAGWRLRYQSQVEPAPRSATAEALSAREGDILKLIAQGLSNKEIARTLTITPETVKSHVKHIFIKMGVEKRAQAVSRAQSLGLVSTH